MSIKEQLEETTGLSDLVEANLTLDKMYSNGNLASKAFEVAKAASAAVAYFEGNGKKLKIIYSVELKKHFDKLVPGTKVRYEVKTEYGKVINSMTRYGAIPDDAEICYICGSPCIRVDFGNGNESYDAISLIVED